MAQVAQEPDGCAADLQPHCALGEVSFGPRWTVRAPEVAGAPFRLEGDGIAIAIDLANAAELHAQLGQALLAALCRPLMTGA